MLKEQKKNIISVDLRTNALFAARLVAVAENLLDLCKKLSYFLAQDQFESSGKKCSPNSN